MDGAPNINATAILNGFEAIYHPKVPVEITSQFIAQVVLLLVPLVLVSAAGIIRLARAPGDVWFFRLHRTAEGTYIIPNSKTLPAIFVGLSSVSALVSNLVKLQVFLLRGKQWSFLAVRTLIWLPIFQAGYFLVWGSLYATNLARTSIASLPPSRLGLSTPSRMTGSCFSRAMCLNMALIAGSLLSLCLPAAVFILSSRHSDLCYGLYLQMNELLVRPNDAAAQIEALQDVKEWKHGMVLVKKWNHDGFVIFTVIGSVLVVCHLTLATVLIRELTHQIGIYRAADRAASLLSHALHSQSSPPEGKPTPKGIRTGRGVGQPQARAVDYAPRLEALRLLRWYLGSQTAAILLMNIPLLGVCTAAATEKMPSAATVLLTPVMEVVPTWVLIFGGTVVALQDLRTAIGWQAGVPDGIQPRSGSVRRPKNPLTSEEVYQNWQPPKAPMLLASP